MSRFYVSSQGNRSETTRMGTASSGIITHARGWDIGGEVRCDDDDGQDIVSFSLTMGSNNSSKLLTLEFRILETGPEYRTMGGDWQPLTNLKEATNA